MRRLRPPVELPLGARLLVLCVCALGIGFAVVRAVEAFTWSSGNAYGADAAVLTFCAAGLAVRLGIGFARPGATDGLFDVVSVSAALVVVLLALARTGNGWGVADIVVIAGAIAAFPLTLVAKILWG